MKEIQLSKQGKNKGKYVALVDDDDFEYLNKFRWCVQKDQEIIYAVRKDRVDGKQKNIKMQWDILNSKWIDHIDHNGLNNQKSNLRLCSRSENQMNRTKRKGASSIYKGVHFNKTTGKCRAYIQINGKLIHLGYFINEIESAKAYDKKAIELFGKFANINFKTA